MTLLSQDTIVALASGRGEAGVAVIRLSGEDAISILTEVFKPVRAGEWKSGQLRYGSVSGKSGQEIDDCLAVIMHAPKTFTGENVAEIQCHGSPAVVGNILELCIAQGARLAEPGEFSRRAFLNGKMDLAQAEALSDLISARSEAARRLALNQLRGGLSHRIRSHYSQLLDAAAEIEAHIDFPDEDIPELARDRILNNMSAARDGIVHLLKGHEKARICAQGARVILAGEPNAGKSSLFNALVGRERAIVSPHPGTTRDTIEATLELEDLEITLVDTAGIRNEAGEIEQIGIERSLSEIREADLVLLLIGADQPIENPVGVPLEQIDPDRVIRVYTKSDLYKIDPLPGSIQVSSINGDGLSALERLIKDRLTGSSQDTEEVEMSRVRHAECLRNALSALDKAICAFELNESGDLVMVDLRDSLSHIGDILGEQLDEQILDRIFSTFCLGK